MIHMHAQATFMQLNLTLLSVSIKFNLIHEYTSMQFCSRTMQRYQMFLEW
jgi:hypothetical protein